MKEIQLSRGEVAIVDDDDYEWLAAYKWRLYVCKRMDGSLLKYAKRTGATDGRKHTILMHRQILGLTHHKVKVDHRNRDGLDNRRLNLRIASDSLNSSNRSLRSDNTSGFTGVVWRKDRNLWQAQLTKGGITHRIGYYADKSEAIEAYKSKHVQLWGEDSQYT